MFLLLFSANLGKNRQNVDMQSFNHRARPPVDQVSSNERIKDTCQIYNGEACKSYLSGVKIYIHTDDPEELLDIGTKQRKKVFVCL